MKRLSLMGLAVLALAGGAQAEQRHVLQGLFCNTEAQIEETLDHMRLNLPPQAVVELTNLEKVVCVYADKVDFVVRDPSIIGRVRQQGALLNKYEATLVGVLVGGNLRPVEPPVQTFFLHTERLAGATALSGA